MSQQNDNSNEGLIIMIFIFAAGALIWYFLGAKITAGYVYTKKLELILITYTGMEFFFPTLWAKHVAPAVELLSKPANTKYTVEQLSVIGGGIGFFSRFYFLAIAGWVGWLVLKRNPIQRFRTKHSMKSLVNSEKKLWPAIAPIAGLDIVSEPIDKGVWAMSKKPVDFARMYNLLDEDNKLNRARAEKLFAAQLGRLWEGPKRLKPEERALFAAFAAQACGDLEEAKKGLDTLSMSMAEKKPDYSWVEPLINKHYKNSVVQDIVKKHAYVYTVMAALLKKSREYGVLASAQFIWLRPKYRPLWYTLNGVGRRVSFSEVGGIYAHWISEEIAGKAIERPYVIKAVDGLERAILEVKFE